MQVKSVPPTIAATTIHGCTSTPEPIGNANERYPGGACAALRASRSPASTPTADAARPSSSACESSTCAAWRDVKPATMRMRASSRRRSGTVSSIAIAVSSSPTIAAIAREQRRGLVVRRGRDREGAQLVVDAARL